MTRTGLLGVGVAAVLMLGLVPPSAAAPPVTTGAPRAAAAATAPIPVPQAALRRARSFALGQLARTARQVPVGRFPVVAPGAKRWLAYPASSWMAGFQPGELWLAYEATGDPVWARRARARQAPLLYRRHDTSTHDLGFVLLDSVGQGVRLTGSPAGGRVLRDAATALASRYVPAAHTLRSWNGPAGQVTVIVDNMVNLELLFWGARHGGPQRWRDLALQHAVTTRDNLVRADGSTFHAVRFDEATGDRVWRGTVQGLADDSTWARGQAWAVYGFTTAYRETGDPRMLEVARRTADYAVRHAPPGSVPFWDYAAAGDPTAPRDTSAGAALSSGLLELARLDPAAARRATYRRAGLRLLGALAGPGFLAAGSGSRAVLRHAHHARSRPDVGAVYGDYFFLEAMQRAQLLPSTRPALRVASTTGSSGRRPRAVLDARTGTRWSATGRAPSLRLDLGRVRTVTALSVAYWRGDARATRLRVLTSGDGRRWSVARTLVSSGRTRSLETYDLGRRPARYLRVVGLGGTAGARIDLTAVRVRG